MSSHTNHRSDVLPSAAEEVDLRQLEYTETVLQDQLLCPICQCVLTDPCSTSCGHTFCSECINNALEASRSQNQPFKCPIDRHPLSSKADVVPAAFLVASLVNELDVFCPFKDRGCSHRGKKWSIENHVKAECDFVKVKCCGFKEEDDELCEELIERRHVLNRKEDKCVHSVTECPNDCGVKIPEYELFSHLNGNCMNVMAKCPDCMVKLPTPELAQHQEKCLEAFIACTSATHGCTWSGKRAEYEKHASTCHFVQLSPLLIRQDQRMDTLERENKTLRYHVERLTNRSNIFAHVDSPLASSEEGQQRPSQFNDSDLLHMFMECERLRRDVDRLGTKLGELEAKQSMMIIRENCRTAEEIANLRSGFNGLRHQLHYLLAERRAAGVVKQTDGSNNEVRALAAQNFSDIIRDVKL